MARALSALLVSFVAYATPASASIALHAYRQCSSVVKIWGFATALPANRQVHAYFVLDRKDRLTFNVSYSTVYRTSATAPIC